MPHRTLRIVSYNVRYFSHALRGLASTGRSKRRIAEGLAAFDPLPDVICLQEIETISVRSRAAYRQAGPTETQLESFMGELEDVFARRDAAFPYEAYYFRAHVNRIGRTPITTTGLAALVNRRRLAVEAHNAEAPYPITHHHVEMFRNRKQTRICAHVKLALPGHWPLHVFNTHLSLPTPFHRRFWSERWRMGWGVNQVQEARNLMRFVHDVARQDPFVVCGDFNSAPGSPVFDVLTAEHGCECAEARLGRLDPANPAAYPTAGFLRMRMHLDHMLSGNGVKWLDLEGSRPFGDKKSPFAGLSDHVPLVGRFRCAPAGPA